MNTKKQSTKKTVTKTKNNGGNVTEKTQVDEKPSVPEKLLTEKNTTSSLSATGFFAAPDLAVVFFSVNSFSGTEGFSST